VGNQLDAVLDRLDFVGEHPPDLLGTALGAQNKAFLDPSIQRLTS
jgi:hypothetical protein